MKVVHKNAQPFFFKGGKTGCLLIHGFTGSPSEIRLLGEYLAKKGLTVSGILLAGHGTTPEDMLKSDQYMWYNSVVEEFKKLQTKCEHIYLIGLSMGGLLALHGALNLPVKGVAALSTPIYLVDRRIPFLPILKRFVKFHPNNLTGKGEKEAKQQGQPQNTDLHKKQKPLKNQGVKKNRDILIRPEQRLERAQEQEDKQENKIAGNNAEGNNRFAYDKIPLKCLDYLLELIMKIKSDLPNIKVPVLVMQSHQDLVVQSKSASFIYDHLGSEEKELFWLYKSGHVITLGQEREEVFEKIYDFIKKGEESL